MAFTLKVDIILLRQRTLLNLLLVAVIWARAGTSSSSARWRLDNEATYPSPRQTCERCLTWKLSPLKIRGNYGVCPKVVPISQQKNWGLVVLSELSALSKGS